MKNNPLLITDADAIIALLSVQDANHSRAAKISRYCSDNQASLLFPITALCEATTILRKRLNNPEGVIRLIENTRSGNFPIQFIDQDVFTAALSVYQPYGSKQNTLFDAIIAALAKHLNATAIFSFDGWYKKQGFTLASDLLPPAPQEEPAGG